MAEWAQLVSHIFVIVGTAFAVWQVLELRADRRRENAMQYATMLIGETYADTALDISVAIQEAAGPNDRRLSLRNVQKMADFYLSALDCRETGVCDAATIDAQFRETILGFYRVAFDDELLRISCRIKQSPTLYAEPLRGYLNATRAEGAPEVAATTHRCPNLSPPPALTP